jgi:hypothetical protein
LLENQLDFLLLFLTSFQESSRALCPLRVPLNTHLNQGKISMVWELRLKGSLWDARIDRLKVAHAFDDLG